MEFSTDFLRTYVALCEERSFTSAARRLRKSQSTVSSQLAALETTVGVKLLERSPRPVRPTEAGRILLDFAKELAGRTRELERALSAIAGGIAGEVRIGAITSIATYLLPKIVDKIREDNARIRIVVSTQPIDELCRSVREGELDFGLVLSNRQPAGLAVKILAAVSLWFVVAAKSPLAKRKLVTIPELQLVPFVLGIERGGYTQMVESLLQQNGFSRYSVASRISSFEGMKEFVRIGMGVTLLPDFTVKSDIDRKTLRRVPVKNFEFAANILLVERLTHTETPAVALVKNLIKADIQRIENSHRAHPRSPGV